MVKIMNLNSQPYGRDPQKERIRQRVRVQIDEANYEYVPERVESDAFDDAVSKRVAAYVRVSTDDIRQTTSYELQKWYYEELVRKHPNWTLVGIYADEGISGTSLKHRDAFNRMIADCKAGKIDMVITKSVSRFSRNVVDLLSIVRTLYERYPAIGVFFETENIYSINEKTSMSLTMQATMAEEESRNKSRSMETSLRIRLDHGLPLTPKLLGFTHNEDGKLIPNLETCNTPKLMFYMYLYGYSKQQIAEALNYLDKKSYLGNVKWTSSGVLRILRNERYCGDVYTRKTYTVDVLSHKTVKNRGERPISRYYNEHIAIISRDDWIAVQHMLNNDRYGNKALLPELRVIDAGPLKGFVVVNTRWSGFTAADYYRASESVYSDVDNEEWEEQPYQIAVEAGDFDMRGFEVAHTELFGTTRLISMTLNDKGITFSVECVRRMKNDGYVELLIHPIQKRIAVRFTTKDNKNAVIWSKTVGGVTTSRTIACTAIYSTLMDIFGWSRNHRYRICAANMLEGEVPTIIFNANEATAYIRQSELPADAACGDSQNAKPVSLSRGCVACMPKQFVNTFGNAFYVEQTFAQLAKQTRQEWKTRIEGQLFSTGMRLNVTDYETLRSFIASELGNWRPPEEEYNV